MTQDNDLFSTPAPAASTSTARPRPTESIDIGQSIQDAWNAANKDPLPETLDALKRIPEALRAAVEAVSNRIYQNAFIQSYEQAYKADPKLKSKLHTASMQNYTAKLFAFSVVGHFSGSPWHVADSALLAQMSRSLRGAEDLTPATELMDAVKTTNVFVAATESDDRDSYLKAVKGMVGRQKINQLVLDAELIEWRPQSDFMDACSIIGIPPAMVGISDRKSAGKHGFMLSTAQTGVPSIFVDTKGRSMVAGRDGAMMLAEQVAVRPVQKPAAQAAVSQAEPAPTGVAPSSGMQDRLKSLRATQVRRMSPKG